MAASSLFEAVLMNSRNTFTPATKGFKEGVTAQREGHELRAEILKICWSDCRQLMRNYFSLL